MKSQQQSDYEVNLNTFVEANCDLIVPVGFLLADATSAAADTNTDQKFAIVDVDYLAQTNVLGNASKIDQATFLAGYLAAGMTKTGKVGTYVGILFPATQAFMDGYAMGVAKYNEVHGTSVTGTRLEHGNPGRSPGRELRKFWTMAVHLANNCWMKALTSLCQLLVQLALEHWP